MVLPLGWLGVGSARVGILSVGGLRFVTTFMVVGGWMIFTVVVCGSVVGGWLIRSAVVGVAAIV
jgi:hypothetical protein